ncbi:helix-turn-helix domain-containing protein [Castellaniella sp.]|uniref:AraC-like ligand-binding domain-containing protein n=1 Tax=Castellaniella sp. TaxID=1955812 RepID=UPI002AFE9F65|nr:helix-turn-helix domain-containing protein [Castellaniella sp.]
MIALAPSPEPPVTPGCWLQSKPRRFNDRAAWSDAISQHFVPLEVETPDAGPFYNLAANETLGCLQVSELITSAQRVRRTRVLANRSDSAQYKFSIQLSGRSQIVQDGRTAILLPGDWGFYDTSRPYEVCVDSNAHFLVLRIPSAILAVWESTLQTQLATCFGSGDGSARIAVDALRSLVGQGQALTSEHADRISATVMQLFALSLVGPSDTVAEAKLDDVRQGQLRVIMRHIHQNLHDADMTATTLALRFRMSRRYLYKLFAMQDLKPADYILGVRLERCRDLLGDDGCARSMTEIAHAHGFLDSSAFSHAFRRRFGMSPTEWRSESLQKPVS